MYLDSFDYSKSQVAKETGISRIILDKIWERIDSFRLASAFAEEEIGKMKKKVEV